MSPRPALLALLLSISCDPDKDTDSATPPVDAVSSATPGVPSAVLTSAHPAWGDPDCNACHPGSHQDADWRPPECATCHGSNGAPPRPAGHDDAACIGCHDETHAALGLTSDNDCRSCHPYDPAAWLARNGRDVVVLERNHKVGGYMSNFRRGDYRFEVSLHALDAMDPDPLRPDDPDSPPKGMNVDIFRKLGILDEDPALSKIIPVKPDPMYQTVYPEPAYSLAIPADPDEYEALLASSFPDEAEGIHALFDEMAAVDGVMRIILDYTYSGRDLWGADMADFFAEIEAAGLTETLLRVQQYLADDTTTLSDWLSGYVSDPKLVSLFTRLVAFAGAEPDRCSVLFFIVMWNNYHFGGFYYFEGGSESVAMALAEVVEENGGTVRLHSTVDHVAIGADSRVERVQVADGTCYEADWYVGNINAPSLLLDLIGEEYLPTADPSSPYHPDRIRQGTDSSMEIGLPAFGVYLGVDYDYSPLFGDTHEIMLAETFDPNQDFTWIRENDIEQQGYAICNYTMVDPTNAPAGKNVIGLTGILTWDYADAWHYTEDRAAYEALKREMAMKLVARAEADFLPELSQHIEVMEVGSPHTLEGFTLNPQGTIFGWANIPDQSMNLRMPQQSPFPNLLLAGAWTFPGGGQSAVIDSGWMAASLILAAEDATP